MIAGLEFLKSWRFWVVLTASTSAVMLGVACANIVSTLYFPLPGGNPNPLYPSLAGLVVFVLIMGLLWFFYRPRKRGTNYPEGHNLRFSLGIAVATAIVVIIENLAVTRLLLDPVLGANEYQHFSLSFAFLFGIIFGQWVAMTEWTAMMGMSGEEGRAVSPDSP
jgi:hypothetical protein